MQTLELNKILIANCTPLNENELIETNGGGTITKLLVRCIPVVGQVLVAVDVICTAWDCGSAMGQGIVDGYNSKTKK